ncbi:UTP--glucose-1-phosphate uridylyltransferase [Necator americanus]|uniref:UTP--glucose-1-phosphate uridylyltransferase n=1 Tax=Necator americanus TaxID=51031 RepID=W2TCS6_NECAM|nr:UTP--glucose-1-phosphate uridylyltransferase [Necator americanus]ETN79840.1 UTP--glucose-1-phosphate uridylyltransferase [Necator americanus]
MHISAEKKVELLEKLDEFFRRTDKAVTVSGPEANVFRQLYRQFLEEKHYIDWNSWKFIAEGVQRNHDDLSPFDFKRKDVLDRLVVVKLNGGLGTTMGCNKPKSFIKIKGDLSFLDIARQQHEAFNKTHDSKVPLFLMNSFYTDQQTKSELGPHSDVRTFCQSRCPRIWADSLLPVEDTGTDQEWYPPGHGNIFQALGATGVLDELLNQGTVEVDVSDKNFDAVAFVPFG